MRIIVTGSVGTGKTTFAQELSRLLGLPYINLGDYLRKKDLFDSYDKKRDCEVISEKKLAKELLLLAEKKKKFVIDSHMAQLILPKFVDACFVTTCDLKKLHTRLVARGYSEEKIRENLDTEIFQIVLGETQENGHLPILLDTTSTNWAPIVTDLLLANF